MWNNFRWAWQGLDIAALALSTANVVPDFQALMLPALEAFGPDLVIISAGFDAHRDDPLADVQLSTGCFRWMTERLMEVAARHGGGRLLSVLEGGYNLERLGDCVSAHVERLMAPL